MALEKLTNEDLIEACKIIDPIPFTCSGKWKVFEWGTPESRTQMKNGRTVRNRWNEHFFEIDHEIDTITHCRRFSNDENDIKEISFSLKVAIRLTEWLQKKA
jgi:hypothetical protein